MHDDPRPGSIPAAHDVVAAIVRDCCESDRPEKWDADTIEMRVSDLKLIVERHVAALAAPKAEAWQPIETAPKDGTRLLLWEQYSVAPFVGYWLVPLGRWTVCLEHVDAKGGWDGAVPVACIEMPITHWAPLPPDPNSPAPQEES